MVSSALSSSLRSKEKKKTQNLLKCILGQILKWDRKEMADIHIKWVGVLTNVLNIYVNDRERAVDAKTKCCKSYSLLLLVIVLLTYLLGKWKENLVSNDTGRRK